MPRRGRGREAAASLASWARASGLSADDVVPAATTVLFDGCDPAAVEAALPGWTGESLGDSPSTVLVSVTYDGPDLERVAEHWGCSPDEVVARHADHRLHLPLLRLRTRVRLPRRARRPTSRFRGWTAPRSRVEPGSVAIADRWCGIYPTASPGGWLVIGRTDETLWDASRDSPALLAPGTRVRLRGRAMSIEVLDPGPLSTLQDRGRTGWAHLGVARAGALDRGAPPGPAAGRRRTRRRGGRDHAGRHRPADPAGGDAGRHGRALRGARRRHQVGPRRGGHGARAARSSPSARRSAACAPTSRSPAGSTSSRSSGRGRPTPLRGWGRPASPPGRCWPSGRRAGGPNRLLRSSYAPGRRCCGCDPGRGPTGWRRARGTRSTRRRTPSRRTATGSGCGSTDRGSSVGPVSCPARGWCSARCSCRPRGSRWCSWPTTRRRAATRSSRSSRTPTSTCAPSCGPGDPVVLRTT